MRRSWRWLLGSLAALALLLALFVWDAIRRAEAAIDAHERQVALDIAALRAAHSCRPSAPDMLRPLYTTGPISLHSLRNLEVLNDSGRFYEYELTSRTLDYWFPSPVGRFRVKPPPSPEQALASLALPHDLLRGGGVERALARQSIEENAIRDWRRLLQDQKLSAHHLEQIARTLDLLLSQRTPLREALEGERVLDRLRVLRVLRTRSDPDCTMTAKPRWRSLFLWRVFIATTLSSTDRMYRGQARIASLPPPERAAAAARYEIEQAGQLPPIARWDGEFARLFASEAETLRDWTLLRVAVAIAWFEAEHGRRPHRLEELTPRHLDAAPHCPVTRIPISYTEGQLIAGVEPGTAVRWPLSRDK